MRSLERIITSEVAPPTGRDSATFREGTEVPSLSRDKGTSGQAKNLAKGRDGPGQPKSGSGNEFLSNVPYDLKNRPGLII